MALSFRVSIILALILRRVGSRLGILIVAQVYGVLYSLHAMDVCTFNNLSVLIL